MRSSPRAGVVAIAAVALGIGLAGCGSDTETAPSTSATETTNGSNTATSQAGPDKTIADYIKENNIVETRFAAVIPARPRSTYPAAGLAGREQPRTGRPTAQWFTATRHGG